MKEKLKIITRNATVDVYLTNCKLIKSFDSSLKYRIISTIKNYFNKLGDSEFAIEQDETSTIMIEEEKLNLTDFAFYYIDENEDLFSDLKMGTKSISLKYVEAILNKIEYTEEYQTLNIVYNDLIDFLNDKIDDDFDTIKPVISSLFEKKQLIKLLQMTLMNDDLEINDNDLEVEDKIIIQLNMIKKISRYEHRKTIILLKVSKFIEEYQNIIDTFNENVSFMIFFDELNVNIQPEDLLILEKDKVIDLYDDNIIFDLCMNYYADISISKMKEKLVEKVILSSKI